MDNKPEVISVKSLFAKDDVKQRFQEMLGKRATSFITSVLQIVSLSEQLAKADSMSVYQSAAMAATLDLPLNASLGFAYIIPFNQNSRDENGNWVTKVVATFQIGYKGIIQLAQRSGQFKSVGVTRVLDGQLLKNDPLMGPVFNWDGKKSDVIIGYAAGFSLINGFEKITFHTVDEVRGHGKKYSQTFKKDKGLWVDEFDTMAQKTVLKLLLSKYAPLSVDMQRAVIADQSVVNDVESLDVSYPDHSQATTTPIDKETERLYLMIGDAHTIDDLIKLKTHLKEDQAIRVEDEEMKLLDVYLVKLDSIVAMVLDSKKTTLEDLKVIAPHVSMALTDKYTVKRDELQEKAKKGGKS